MYNIVKQLSNDWRTYQMGCDVNLKNNYNKLPDGQNGCNDETKMLIRQAWKRL